MGMWRALLCRVGWHKKLQVIQSFGSGKHIGCPDCGKEYAMHLGQQVCVPWDSEFDELYQAMGFDTETVAISWREWRVRHYRMGTR